MAASSVLYLAVIYKDLIDHSDAQQYIAELILLGVALATVVGVLVEVLVMLSLVGFAKKSKSILSRSH